MNDLVKQDDATVIKNRKVATRIAILSIAPEWQDILAELAIQPRYVTELTCLLNLRQPTVSNRLRRMRDAGLVDYCEVASGTPAPSHLYRLVPEAIQATVEDIRATARRIEETATTIESYIQKKKRRSA